MGACRLFFQEADGDLESPNFTQERIFTFLSLPIRGGDASFKEAGSAVQQVLSPLGDLHGMDLVSRSDFVEGALTLERFQGHFGLEYG
jgi:hypothetical protein